MMTPSSFEMPNLLPAVPEIFVLAATCVILLADLYIRDDKKVITYLMSLATLVGAAVLTITLHTGDTVLTFSGSFVSDPMGDVLKVFVYLVTAAVFVYSRNYLIARNLFKGEFFTLGLFGVLGMMVLISAQNMLTLYLGLELLSLCMYAMVALQRDSINATEAAMKYFILGALASGMLLYGMSLIYGITGSLDLAEINAAIKSLDDSKMMVAGLGMVLVIVGMAFKLGAVPFHMWLPDVYHGAPTAITLYISAAPKIAAFAMVMRLLVEGLGDMHAQWQEILIIMAVLSMAVGNIIAIAQANIKRMLAYSTISHVGFLLLGILAGTAAGYSSAMFYTITYALMAAGGFGMILLLSRSGFEADRLEDFKGLSERSPWFALMMLILMFSMAGVPPTVGFYAKLAVLQSVIDVGLVWLAVLGVIFSIIGVFYYLRIIKLMYFDKPVDTAPLETTADMRIILSANALGILYLGLMPGSLLALCVAAIG
ncbi:NADH-ubiquinone oxidoreductase chain N [hydrothermal vent metagenome]|uniref:NADH-ubiquinone oxidoreductase chain N n=1 Tax=hydrothermal vent metagenome TaxID=652676 RepID=A0A3B1AY29_9ZZZZ